jgi:nucleoside-diphosphate-sugar epimerase
MNVLVAGAGGFIGGHLVGQLLDEGHDVLAVLVDLAEEFAGVKLDRRYNLDAPQGVRGRNSDNTRFRELFGWEPSMPLREGLRKTYDWIEQEWLKSA